MKTPSLEIPAAAYHPAGFGLAPAPVGSDDAALDPRAVEQARREIQTLVRELSQLAKTDVAPSAFYEQLLTRTVTALAAVGGAIWLVGEGGSLELAYQINLREARLDEHPDREWRHAALLQSVLTNNKGQLVPPHSGSEAESANPTDFLLLLGPIINDEGPQGLIEILQRPNTRPGTQRGFVRFVQQMCELASDYWKTRRLKHLADKQSLWEQLDQFTRSIHQSLDSTAAAYTIANEGRRLIGCDRVSVALRRGPRCRLAAVSGQDTFDPRSNVITRLERLATAVTATGEPLWYTGNTDDLAPQVERALQAYIDIAHAKAVAVLPLAKPRAEHAPHQPPELLGALIVEQIEDRRLSTELAQRVEVVAEHSAAALSNALQYEGLFLMPVWRALGRMRWVIGARMLPRTLTVLLLVAGVVAILALAPADFALEAKGVLQPVERRDVFARIDGVVIETPVEHGQFVKEGQTLAVLRNTDLDVQITDLIGRREATAEQMQSLQRSLLAESRLSVEEKNRLSGQLLQLRETYESLGLQLELYRHKQEQLRVVSDIEGQVVTWQVGERLLRRPVRQGQILMSLANPDGAWELELHMPEDRMGHIATAARASDQPLEVTYILATRPGESHVGQVKEIEAAAEVRGEQGNTVLIEVAIDKSKLADLRPGATVTAKVACGQRSLGYVWLHDLFGFVQRKILFRW